MESTEVIVEAPSGDSERHEAALDSERAVEPLSVAALEDIADGLAKVQRSTLVARSLHPSGAAIEPRLRPVPDRPAEASSAT